MLLCVHAYIGISCSMPAHLCTCVSQSSFKAGVAGGGFREEALHHKTKTDFSFKYSTDQTLGATMNTSLIYKKKTTTKISHTNRIFRQLLISLPVVPL